MNDEQLLRYSRQIMLPSVGIEGQQRLLESRVLIIGLGGLGSPASMYLAAGKLKYRAHKLEGLESAIEGINLLFTGGNTGKLMVEL